MRLMVPHYDDLELDLVPDLDRDVIDNVTASNVTLTQVHHSYYHVFCYMSLLLGIPGNILSAIAWTNIYCVTDNSSSIYLIALSINDLIVLIAVAIQAVFDICRARHDWFWQCARYTLRSASRLQTLILLVFCVDRLIAILHPLQVNDLSPGHWH